MKPFWILIPVIGMLSGCIDDQYRLDRLDNHCRVFKNLEVPVGNTRELTLEDLLGKDPATIPPREDGTYLVQMTTGIEDVDVSLSNLSFEEAQLSFTAKSTIPLDISVQVSVTDTNGEPFSTSPVRIESDSNPDIPAGSISSPSVSRIRVSLAVGKDRQIGSIQIMMEGKTPAGKKTEALNKGQGIRLEDIYLSIPSGIQLFD